MSARQDVAPFGKDADAIAMWSHEFLIDVGSRIILVGAGRNKGE